MKNNDILPHFESGSISLSEIPLFRYRGSLKTELESHSITREEAVKLFETMVLIRSFEKMIIALYMGNFVPCKGYKFVGATHLCIGQEANAAGMMSVLEKDDFITNHHRGHGHAIAKGAYAIRGMSKAELERFTGDWPVNDFGNLEEAALDLHLYRILAEFFGKQDGYCHGRGGGMHIADLEKGNLGANAIVGGSCAMAVGAAYAFERARKGRIIVCIIGDGAANNGLVHEAMNFAAMKQFERGLPVLFYIENNQYGMTGQSRNEVTGVNYLSQRGAAYNEVNMHAETINGMNVLAVRDTMLRVRKKLLESEGPALLESVTYRYHGHTYKDKGEAYRSEKEKAAWLAEDPIKRLQNELIELGIYREGDVTELEQRMKEKLEGLAMKAAHAKDPEKKDILYGLYAGSGTFCLENTHTASSTRKKPRSYNRDSEGKILFRHAIAEAITEEMARDSRVILFGEDVADYGGGYKVTVGLLETYGRERVFNTPISEAAIIGVGMGAAIFGLRPITEIMYFDFLLLAMDQLGNQVAKTRYMYGGQVTIPLVVRTSIGQAKGYAGQHSQNLETLIANLPGIKIAIPSNPYDAKGLLKTAIRDDNPVLFIEHQSLYLEKGVVPPGEDYTVPFGKAKVIRRGSAMTVISYSNMIKNVVEAADAFERIHGEAVEIIDLLTLVPLDFETVLESVSKTKRCMIVNQAPYFGNFAGFLSHEIQLRLFGRLEAPVFVVSAYDIPPPASSTLEEENIPSAERILEGLEKLVRYA